MDIAIILPYKENFSKEYAGAVSLFVNDMCNNSTVSYTHLTLPTILLV